MPLSHDLLDRILADDGPIARALVESGVDFEHRPEQGVMARAAMEAMDRRGRLLVEAGTGVGKSFAYLVPAILRAVLHNETVVVATATISLQEQIIQKDIPLLQRTLGEWGLGKSQIANGQMANAEGSALGATGPRELVPVLAKGRGNYVSIRRLKIASERQGSILHDSESVRSLHVIEDWAYATRDGTLSTLPALERPEVWEHVRSDTDNCMGRKCPTYQKCFYQMARRELEKANLIVCNHALFFADLAMRSRGNSGGAILPAYDQVILDEAHNVEDAASEHFGLSLSQPRVMRLLRTLFSPRRGKGYLVDRELQLSAAGSEAVERAVHLVIHAEDSSRRFFDALLEYAQRNRATSGRIVRPDVIENDLTPAMNDLAVRLRNIRERIESEPDRFELQAYARRAAEIAMCAEALVAQTMQGFAYWVEVEDRGGVGASARRGMPPRVELACAPVEIAPILRRVLFDMGAEVADVPLDEGGDHDEHAEFVHEEGAEGEYSDEPSPFNEDADGERGGEAASGSRQESPRRRIGIVLTSATLATRTAREDEQTERAETAFAHAMSNLGLPPPPDTRVLQLGSPFDYSRQVTLYVDLSLPSPKSGDARRGAQGESGERAGNGVGVGESGAAYLDALAARVLHHVRATNGGAFVLFTSFATLNGVAERIRRELSRDDIEVLAQGRDGPRTLVLKKFVESERAVLLGAATFWQGVDVRGERLRNVIITRLPFEPPDRPLTQARLERIEERGGNPFALDSLPRAIIRFKQGFGRLIRSKTDRGRVVILDPRIKTARYGKMFLDALPPGVRIEEVRAEADEWC
ncbi:MAG: hypothetical protein KF869_09760 [Phycisphaeraceae bacterium]|nr:hypothetical protein [Phycisphaeraceae bacterium]